MRLYKIVNRETQEVWGCHYRMKHWRPEGKGRVWYMIGHAKLSMRSMPEADRQLADIYETYIPPTLWYRCEVKKS